MTDDIQSFLASSPVFSELPPEQIEQIAPLFREEQHRTGALVLRQGGYSDAVYFVRSGCLAVRTDRGAGRETIAYLKPPDIFGELSFVTGRACVADVEVVVDAEVLALPRDAVPKLPEQREVILHSLMKVIAGRLQETVIRGATVPELPVVLLWNYPKWEAPWSFATSLAGSLARQTERETLLVQLSARERQPVHEVGPKTSVCSFQVTGADPTLRATIAQRLTDWKRRFENVILNPVGPDATRVAEAIQEFANWQGYLVGPGDPTPPGQASGGFAVQDAREPLLAILSGSQQLIAEVAEAEAAHHSSRPLPTRFLRTVDSIARCIAGLQVGLALGGGAAWGWAHIGVLEGLEEAGLPIDMISGCSMGSVIGALRAAGITVGELKEIAEYWRTRTRSFRSWLSLPRMYLINEKQLDKTLRKHFDSRMVNHTEIPYWANAVDINTGKEFAIQDGMLVDCVRASIALPGLLPPFQRNAHMLKDADAMNALPGEQGGRLPAAFFALLVDAGIMDPVPVSLVRRMGCHYAIGVNAMAKFESQRITSRYPFRTLEVMSRCMFLMGHEIGQARAEQAANIVFTPSLGDITMLQFRRAPEIIECGRRAAEAHLPLILSSYERLKVRPAAQETAAIPSPR